MTHPSQRGWFAASLFELMKEDNRIWLLTGDLGYGMLDDIRDTYQERFVNVGASEQLLVGAAVGLAMESKIPICYSITPFIIYRPMEWIRNYLNHEQIPVKLVGSGLNDDYKHDGFSHHAFELERIMACFPKIRTFYPESKESVPLFLRHMIYNGEPSFMALRR